MNARKATIRRKTRETDIAITLNIDGVGMAKILTGIGFLDHMLELFAKHSLMDISVKARGDLQVDGHHTVEDIGICLGEALKKACGTKKGIARYGFILLPMDEALVSVALDFSGRSYLRYAVKSRRRKTGDFDIQLVEEFLHALAAHAGLTLHIDLVCGRNPHHIIEAVFKGLARALAMALDRGGRGKGVPSTKGKL